MMLKKEIWDEHDDLDFGLIVLLIFIFWYLSWISSDEVVQWWIVVSMKSKAK